MRDGESVWVANRSESTKGDLIAQFNYFGKLASQFPISPLRIAYAKAGSLLAACIIKDRRAIIDTSLYWTTPNSIDEATYLTALINAETTRARIEQYQARGQFGARHFDKVIWNLPIPRFNPKLKLHRELAAAGAEAEAAAGLVELVEGEKFQRARKRVRDALIGNGVAAKIETLVEKLLGGG